MSTSIDFSFFLSTLSQVRRLKSYTAPWYITRGAQEAGDPDQLAKFPKMISEPEAGTGEFVFDTTNFASVPGHGLATLQEMVGWPLPPDLIAFYELFEKALVITRTFPLHIWPEEKIVNAIKDHRESFAKPLRVFRFGEQFDREATQFGMRLEEAGTMRWRVISTELGSIDDEDDDYVESDRVLGNSFREWLKDLIDRDGLPDPFMRLGPEGGFIDPV
jgi:hypothetical protein